MIWIYVPLSVFILLISGFPLTYLASKSVFKQNLTSLLFQSGILKSLSLTLTVGIASLVVSLLLALPISYLLARTDLWGKRNFRTLLIFPYFVPSYLFAISWMTLTVPKIGLLNQFFNANVFNIYSFWGIVGVTVNAFFPILVIPLIKGFSSMDPSLEEAGRIYGAPPLKVFFRITLPCLRAPLVGCSTIFLFITLSSFGIPALIGNPAKLYVLTTQIYTVTKMGGVGGAEQGFIISIWLIIFSLLLLFLGRSLKKRFQVPLTQGKASRFSEVRLGKWQLPFVIILVLLINFLVLLPLGALFYSSFCEIAGNFDFSSLTLKHYRFLWDLRETRDAFLNSMSLAFLGASTCCFLGFFIVYFSQRTKMLGSSFLERLASIPFSIPGTILALGFLVTFSAHVSTPFLLFFAYIAKDLAIAIQNLGPALNQIDKSLEEAASICGAKKWKVIDLILYPLMRPHLASVFLLCALPMLSELTMSILLYGPSTETLGTLIFQLQDYSNPLAACALASCIVISISSILFFFNFLSKDTAR